MTLLNKVINEPDQLLISNYTFELHLCGKPIFKLFPTHQVQTSRTPYVKLQRWVLNLMALPVVNPDINEHFISSKDARNRVDKGLSILVLTNSKLS